MLLGLGMSSLPKTKADFEKQWDEKFVGMDELKLEMMDIWALAEQREEDGRGERTPAALCSPTAGVTRV